MSSKAQRRQEQTSEDYYLPILEEPRGPEAGLKRWRDYLATLEEEGHPNHPVIKRWTQEAKRMIAHLEGKAPVP